MWDTTVVACLVGAFLFLSHFREANQRIAWLRARVMRLSQELHNAQMYIAQLEAERQSPESNRKAMPQRQAPIRDWENIWAREVLSLQEGPLTPDRLRVARRKALKAAHPDGGGSARRMRDVEAAVLVLQSKI